MLLLDKYIFHFPYSSENWIEEKQQFVSKLKTYEEKFEKKILRLENDFDGQIKEKDEQISKLEAQLKTEKTLKSELSKHFWQSIDLNALFESKLKEEKDKHAQEQKEFLEKLEQKNREIECLLMKKDYYSLKSNPKNPEESGFLTGNEIIDAHKINIDFESKLIEEQLIKRLENRNQEIKYLNKNSMDLHQFLYEEKVKKENILKELEEKNKECLKKDEQILELRAMCVCQFDQNIDKISVKQEFDDKISVKREFSSGIKKETE